MTTPTRTCGECKHYKPWIAELGDCTFDRMPFWVWGHEDGPVTSTTVRKLDSRATDCECFEPKEKKGPNGKKHV